MQGPHADPTRHATARPAPRPGALLAACLAVLAIVAGAAGCGRVEATVRAQEALRDGGIQGAVISVQERGGETTVQVRYNSRAPDQAALQAEQDTAARLVWANATVPLDVVKVTPDDNPSFPAADTRVYTRDDLTNRFGARPEALDRPPTGGGPRALTYGFVVLMTGLAIVGVVAAVGLVLLSARMRRRRALAAATAWPAPGPADPAPPGLGQGRPGAPDRRQATGGAPPGYRPPPPRRPAPGGGQPATGPRGVEPPPGSWPAPPDA